FSIGFTMAPVNFGGEKGRNQAGEREHGRRQSHGSARHSRQSRRSRAAQAATGGWDGGTLPIAARARFEPTRVLCSAGLSASACGDGGSAASSKPASALLAQFHTEVSRSSVCPPQDLIEVQRLFRYSE